MAFALIISSSIRTTAGFSQRGGARLNRNSSKVSMSFFDDMASNFQRAFSTDSGSQYYTVGITGASGMLGSSLIDELEKQQTVNGKPVRIVKLSRSENVGTKTLGDDAITTLSWNPKATSAETVIEPEALDQIDAIVHLAGENVATGLGPLGFVGLRPWTDAKKAEILDSRVGPTRGLAKAIAASKTPTSFLVASGVGVYGSDFIGDAKPAVDESMDVSSTTGFLTDVSREWEAAGQDAGKNRVVNCRMGVVLSKNGGALAKLFPIFFLGGGGNVGSGNQYFTFISARDAARALVHTLTTPSLKGPVNVCSPEPCTNAEFTSAFGKVLSRPTILPLPGFVVSLLFGEMGDEMLLGGVRATPGKLSNSGFEFQHPTIEEALQSAVDETI
eukprot:CAMPEP_0119019322 /NCGR_PEP_ID=MMETSP1176-20130426/21500_1 /TAXON_ID=265551 /ORGANISM="Synedropsis recta cf, Strain CCMP1620" /LENGTH=387 /DNA_ID=CAMNT_0006973487 /DNA_START=54 /DNA_END=1217 /DNA_ORIENTATION=-